MRATQIVINQLSRPRGRLAGLAAAVLNASNRAINRHAVAMLDPKPGDRIVDIGFGGGAGLKELLRYPRLQLAGVDLSAAMVQRAQRRLRREGGSGRLVLHQGGVERLPFEDAEFDGAMTINTVYFWTDCRIGMAEILRVLRPGAVAVIGMERGGHQLFSGQETDGRRLNPPTVEEVTRLMTDAGFEAVSVQEHPGGRALIRGYRPADS
jgi:SAM-dependent methyltransferase